MEPISTRCGLHRTNREFRAEFRDSFSFLCGLIIVCFSFSSSAELAGRYQTKGQNISVNVQSWGDDCGPRPRSASGGGGKIVDVRRAGQHLAIGGQRTDRCWSRNPRVQRQRAVAGTNSWTVTCQTPAGDPRFEHGQYTVQQVGPDTLRFNEVSSYDWRLEGDHCKATVNLTRTYVRLPDSKQPSPEPPPEREPQPESRPVKCSGELGRPVRLDVRPSRVTIEPGERVCLRAVLRDTEGCPITTSVSWAIGSGGARGGRLVSDGCFVAGTAAGESEGNVVVFASYRNLKAKSQILVRFPDIGDLVAARLAEGVEGLEEPDGETAVVEARPGAAQGVGQTRVGPVREDDDLLWIIGLLTGGIVTLLVTVAVLLARRRRRTEDSIAVGEEMKRVSAAMAIASSHPPAPLQKSQKICPTCKQEFMEALEYCPDDASKLVAAKRSDEESRRVGSLVCPRCRRGYEGNERFCSHDHEELIPYSVWRASQLEAKHAQKSSGAGMICPTCASRYEQDILFCQKDGTKLEPIN